MRKLTRLRQPDAYIRMMLRAYEFSATLQDEDIDTMEKYLIKCEAFKEPMKGQLKFNGN